MQIKVKSLVLAASLFLNGIFALLFVTASMSENSYFSFYAPDGYVTAAAVVSAPPPSAVVFDLIEITLKPGGKALLQFSVVSGEKRQGNVLITALYDPDIVSVTQTGYGIEVAALRGGSTLMQTLTNGGIKDIALITVEE